MPGRSLPTLDDNVELNDRQRQQVDAIASLVTQPDLASIRQGVELAAALDEQSVFAALLDGVEPPAPVPKKREPQRRYPSVSEGAIFERLSDGKAWTALARAHLLAASEHPLRLKVRSLALGAPKSRTSNVHPSLWLDGLERFTALTHLDLLLSSMDAGMDLRVLQRFPHLTHVRLRGSNPPGPLPSLEHLEVLDGMQVHIGSDAVFPALRFVRGRLMCKEPLTPAKMPSLMKVEARGGIELEGFDSLRTLWCNQGTVSVRGLQKVDRLSVIGATVDAPDLRHVGTLVGAGPGIDIAQFETLDAVQFNRTSRLSGGRFPKGTTLLHPKVSFWGPGLTDLGNVGELAGLEILSLVRVKAPISLETLRHAKSLRVLDIRNSSGITDLSPLIGLPDLEVIVMRDVDTIDVPDELADKIRNNWRDYNPSQTAKAALKTGTQRSSASETP